MMSAVPSLSTILSLLSFLTTVFALARVGAAAFSANNHQTVRDSPESPSAGAGAERTTTWSAYTRAAQPAAHLLQLQLGGPGPGSVTGAGAEMSFAQAVRFGLSLEGGKERDTKDRKGEKEKIVGYIGGHDLVRMPASTWTGMRRPGLLFRPREFDLLFLPLL